MKRLTHLSLFSGIGGLDLAAEWAGIKTVGQCEWAEYPSKVLEKHWPDVPRWKDIRTLTGESFHERTGRRTVDIISGGFPCQPFSFAGKRRGREDDRYLWPEMVRVIKELRPDWVVGENVAGIVRMALPDILSEMEACGYRTRTFLIPACAVGARHRRYRVAIIGCREGAGHVEDSGDIRCSRQEDVREQPWRTEPERTGQTVANAESIRPEGLSVRKKTEFPGSGSGGEDVQYPDSARRKEQHTAAEPDKKKITCGGCYEGDGSRNDIEGRAQKYEPGERREPESGMGGVADGLPGWVDGYWDIEPDIPRIAKGIPHRCDRLKALGNAVVPQQFYPVFKAIAEVEYVENQN